MDRTLPDFYEWIHRAVALPDDHEKTIDRLFPPAKETLSELPGVRPYIVCFTNRCGSNFVSETFATTGLLGRPLEIFLAESVEQFSKNNEISSLAEYTLKRVKTLSTQNKVFGVKLGALQLLYLTKRRIIFGLLPCPVFVHVTRQDVISQAVSYTIADQTKKWTSLHQGNDVEPVYDPKTIAEKIRNIYLGNALFEYFFQLHCIDPVRITYEEFCKDPEPFVSALGKRLKVVKPLVIKPKKIRIERQASSTNDDFKERFLAEMKLNR